MVSRLNVHVLYSVLCFPSVGVYGHETSMMMRMNTEDFEFKVRKQLISPPLFVYFLTN